MPRIAEVAQVAVLRQHFECYERYRRRPWSTLEIIQILCGNLEQSLPLFIGTNVKLLDKGREGVGGRIRNLRGKSFAFRPVCIYCNSRLGDLWLLLTQGMTRFPLVLCVIKKV